MPRSIIRLKKGEDRRIRAGHPWIFSNEVNTAMTPLNTYAPGEEIVVQAHDGTLLGAAYVNPHSLIVARLFSRDSNQCLDVNFFKHLLSQALRLRTRLFDQPYYRLIFAEADGLPGVVIDRFANHFVMQLTTAGMESKASFITEALCALVPETQSILLRNDSTIREHEGLEAYVKPIYGTPPEKIRLQENGVIFSVPFWTGQKTGWFYDHRMNRARLKNYVLNSTVLDVFSYLGAFAIEAATFGAIQVACIEASAPACDFIVENATLNQVAHKVHVICSDAFDAMKMLRRDNKQFDVIILDPPAFVKKRKDHKEGMIAYQRINELALKLLAPNGVLITCSCSMHISIEDLMQIVKRAAFRTQSTLQILERGHQAPDHPIHLAIPETDYLKVIFIRKLS